MNIERKGKMLVFANSKNLVFINKISMVSFFESRSVLSIYFNSLKDSLQIEKFSIEDYELLIELLDGEQI